MNMANTGRYLEIMKVLYYTAFVFIVIGALVGGVICRDAITFQDGLRKPSMAEVMLPNELGYVCSRVMIQNQIEDCFYVNVPTDVTNLYFAMDGFIDVDAYAAMTFSSEQMCNAFLDMHFRCTIEGFRETSAIPESLSNHGPAVWSEELKGNWDMQACRTCYCFEYGVRKSMFGPVEHIEIVYLPEQCRLFLHKD